MQIDELKSKTIHSYIDLIKKKFEQGKKIGEWKKCIIIVIGYISRMRAHSTKIFIFTRKKSSILIFFGDQMNGKKHFDVYKV